MIEKIARALCQSDADYKGNAWENHIEQAKACLNAMINPEDDVLSAMDSIEGFSVSRKMWNDGIQACLKRYVND